MTVRGACSGAPCDNGGMRHSILLPSTVQLPLATSIVAADPTGLEWLLLIAAPVVFCVVYLACIMAIAAFGPLVMRNNKSGGTTYLLDRPSRVAFRTRTVALFALVGAFVELIWLGYTGRVGSIAVIPISSVYVVVEVRVLLPAASADSCLVCARNPRQVRCAVG